jgi:hypothetical protein
MSVAFFNIFLSLVLVYIDACGTVGIRLVVTSKCLVFSSQFERSAAVVILHCR